MNPVIQLMFFTISHHTKKSGPCTPEEEGGRNTTADVLEGFAPGLALGGRGAKNDCGRTRRLRPGARARGEEVTTSRSHKFPSKTCSAEAAPSEQPAPVPLFVNSVNFR